MTDSRYQNGKIYIVKNNINDNYYIGSTIQPLRKRLSSHLRDKRCSSSLSQYVERVKCKCYIELINDYPCNSKQELEAEEARVLKEYTHNKPLEEYKKCINKYKFNSRSREEIDKDNQRERNVSNLSKYEVFQHYSYMEHVLNKMAYLLYDLYGDLKKEGRDEQQKKIYSVMNSIIYQRNRMHAILEGYDIPISFNIPNPFNHIE